MKRHAIVLLTMTGLTLGAVAAMATGVFAASPQATLKAVTVSDSATGRELLLRMEGTCAYRTVQAADDTLFIDLAGARAGEIPKTAQWASGLLAGYRLLRYTDAGGQPVVRVQIVTRQHQPFTIRQERAGLRVLFEEKAAPLAASSPALVTAASAVGPRAPFAGTSTAASAQSPVRVSDISIKDGETGETFVDVATSSAPTFQVLQLENPRRLVVDLEEAHNATHRKLYAAHSALLKDVRVGQFRESRPAVVRVVADLAGDPAFDVHPVPGGVRIELRRRELAKALKSSLPAQLNEPAPQREAAQPAEAAVASPAPASPPVRSEPAAQTPQPAAPAVTASASPSVAATVPVRDTLQVDYQNALPAAPGSTQAAAAPRPAPPSQTPEALQAEKAARTLALTIPASLRDAPGAAPGGAGQAAAQPQYSGEPISVNLKDVDLKDFFRLIHEISGLSIIVDPNVAGSVTVVLEQVPWDQALDIVLKNNSLGKTLEGNVVRIAKLETLTAEQAAAGKLAAAREESMPLVTVFRPVNYAKADAIAGMLMKWPGGGALTKRGQALVDPRTNTLIISDIQSQIAIIENIVSKLDKKAKQVIIEARVVLASSSFSRSLQAVLLGTYFNRATSTAAASSGQGVVLTVPVPGTFTDPTKLPPPPGAGGSGAFSILNVGARYAIDVALAAAETHQQAKTISRPIVITQNNVTANIVQGTQIPVTTVIGTTVITNYTSAALTMAVTPQVTEDGNVFMIINVSNNSPGTTSAITGNTSINTQSASTQVLVPDGGMVVFGGVTVTTRSKNESAVPLLGSIPILGHLFKSSNISETDSELLFFVSPRVLPT